MLKTSLTCAGGATEDAKKKGGACEEGAMVGTDVCSSESWGHKCQRKSIHEGDSRRPTGKELKKNKK